jgi:hypothetical protein
MAMTDSRVATCILIVDGKCVWSCGWKWEVDEETEADARAVYICVELAVDSLTCRIQQRCYTLVSITVS